MPTKLSSRQREKMRWDMRDAAIAAVKRTGIEPGKDTNIYMIREIINELMTMPLPPQQDDKRHRFWILGTAIWAVTTGIDVDDTGPHPFSIAGGTFLDFYDNGRADEKARLLNRRVVEI